MANWEADHAYVSSAGVKKGVTVLLLLHMPSQHAHGQLCLYLIFRHTMALVQGFFTGCNDGGKGRGSKRDRQTGREREKKNKKKMMKN